MAKRCPPIVVTGILRAATLADGALGWGAEATGTAGGAGGGAPWLLRKKREGFLEGTDACGRDPVGAETDEG